MQAHPRRQCAALWAEAMPRRDPARLSFGLCQMTKKSLAFRSAGLLRRLAKVTAPTIGIVGQDARSRVVEDVVVGIDPPGGEVLEGAPVERTRDQSREDGVIQLDHVVGMAEVDEAIDVAGPERRGDLEGVEPRVAGELVLPACSVQDVVAVGAEDGVDRVLSAGALGHAELHHPVMALDAGGCHGLQAGTVDQAGDVGGANPLADLAPGGR